MEDDQRCAARNGLDRRVAVMSAVQKIKVAPQERLDPSTSAFAANQQATPIHCQRFCFGLCSSTTRSMNYGVSVKGYTEQS
jgi:hypothetical protein